MIEAEWWEYDSIDEMADAVAGDVGFIVESALDARGSALLALPGGKTPLPIYERLLLDLIEGDPTLFVRRDEVEAQWQWIDGVRAAWEAAGIAPKSYGAGSWGPSAAIALAERNGVSWND